MSIILANSVIALAVQLTLSIILILVYRENRLMSSLYFALTFLGLSIFTISIIYEELLGLNNAVFFIGSSLGITGAYFSLLFWESTKTRNIYNNVTIIGSILYGSSIGSLLLYCFNRSSLFMNKILAGLTQLIFYSYITAVALHAIYLMNKFSGHELIKKQVKLFTLLASVGYGFTELFLVLSLSNIISWKYIFIVYTAISSIIVILYVKNPLLFVYLPDSLYELKDLDLERIMLTTLTGALIWSRSRKDTARIGVEDELVSNLIAALEIFGQETLNVKPRLNVLSIRINNKVLYIKRYHEIQCLVIANKIPKILQAYLDNYLREVYKVIPISELPKVSRETLEKIEKIYNRVFRYLFMLQETKL